MQQIESKIYIAQYLFKFEGVCLLQMTSVSLRYNKNCWKNRPFIKKKIFTTSNCYCLLCNSASGTTSQYNNYSTSDTIFIFLLSDSSRIYGDLFSRYFLLLFDGFDILNPFSWGNSTNVSPRSRSITLEEFDNIVFNSTIKESCTRIIQRTYIIFNMTNVERRSNFYNTLIKIIYIYKLPTATFHISQCITYRHFCLSSCKILCLQHRIFLRRNN